MRHFRVCFPNLIVIFFLISKNSVVKSLLCIFVYLGVLGVASFPLALLIFVRETNAEYSQEISICGLHINVSLDKGLPLLDHGPQFVGGQVHAMEVGQDIASLNVFCDQPEFTERPFSVIVALKISKRNFEHSELQTLGGDLWSTKLVLTTIFW